MKTDVLLVAVLSVVALSPWLGRVTRLPVPTVQFVCGCLLAVVPAAGLVNVSPELILLVVLPLILFWEGYQTSVAWAERYWRPMVLNGVLLVIVTAGTVAAIAHAFGFAWPAAWALGAVLAPTDASAVAAFGRKLPTSWMTALRGESLINDGTALVVLAVALDAAGHKHPGVGSIALRGTQSYGVGIAAGLAVAAVMLLLLPRVTDPMVNATFAIALPLLAAVPAEALGGSGVVAVVTCGLAGSRGARRISSARMRLPTHAFWQITTFVLSGGLFVLTGVLARRLVTGTSAAHAGALLLEGMAIFVAVLAVRLAWISVWTVLLRTFDRRPQQREIRLPSRARLVTVWGGLRGGISLAAALTIPASISGTPFDHRADVLVLTFVVVALSLLVQGSTLGRLDPHWLREHYQDRQRSLKDIAAETGVPVEALASAARKAGIRVRHGIDARAHPLAALGGPAAFPADVWNLFTRPGAEQRIRWLLALPGQPGLQHAARQLGVRNAILASHLRQLETTVGTALLRTGPDGRLTLTAYGELFARDVRPALESLAQSGAGPPDTHRDHGHSA